MSGVGLPHLPARTPCELAIVSGRSEFLIELEQFLAGRAVARPRILLISGMGSTAEVAVSLYEDVRTMLGGPLTHVRAKGHCLADWYALPGVASELGVDLVIAVGGGRVIDGAKCVCARAGVDLVAVPSALSNDGIASPVAVLQGDAGNRRRERGAVPAAIIVDTHITRLAPLSLSVGGICDVLSNASALLDATDGRRAGHTRIAGMATALATGAYRAVCGMGTSDLATEHAHSILAQALFLSGHAMLCAGNSVPCSGAEHAISHAIDDLLPAPGPHGLQVGVSTLFCHHLRQRTGFDALPTEVHQTLLSYSSYLSATMATIQSHFLDAVRASVQSRPDRVSIVDLVDCDTAFRQAMNDTLADLVRSS